MASDISNEARAAMRQSDTFDLHIDTFIPMRLWGYNVTKEHGLGLLRGRFGGHLDLPRMKAAGLDSAMWSVTTNPFRSSKGRQKTVEKNFVALREKLEQGGVVIANNYESYMAAKRNGNHAALLSIQGGNALDALTTDGTLPDPDLIRVTLVHLTDSKVGKSSSPFQLRKQPEALTDVGRNLVKRLNDERVFVDLAHISKQGFWQALEVHDKTQPFLVTHTGVDGVKKHWRNLDDKQIRAVAASGGTIGIIFSSLFLRPKGRKNTAEIVVDHMQHIIDVVGEDFVSLGSDYDGAITPPKGLRSGDSYPLLVQIMLERGWKEGRIEKVLGGNFLRCLRELRG